MPADEAQDAEWIWEKAQAKDAEKEETVTKAGAGVDNKSKRIIL